MSNTIERALNHYNALLSDEPFPDMSVREEEPFENQRIFSVIKDGQIIHTDMKFSELTSWINGFMTCVRATNGEDL